MLLASFWTLAEKNICATIRIGWKIRCLPYARFFPLGDGGSGVTQLLKKIKFIVWDAYREKKIIVFIRPFPKGRPLQECPLPCSSMYVVVIVWEALWQTRTIQYWRRLTGRLEWPGGLWKFWSSSLPHQRARALALWRLNRAWLGMSKFGYLNEKQGHFKLTMLCLFIHLLIYYIWALVDMR